MKIKVSANYSGVIPTGSYENERFGYMAETEFEIPKIINNSPEDKVAIVEEVIKESQEKLGNICYDMFKTQAKKCLVERIERDFKNLRFYPNGKSKVPSVTSIINTVNPKNFHMPMHELNQYAARGSIRHLQVEHYIMKGEWFDPEEITKARKYLQILKDGNLHLPMTGDFINFEKSYPIDYDNDECEKVVYNKEYEYAGRLDFTGIPVMSKDWEKAEALDVPTIFDLKSSADETPNLKQLAAYAKSDGMDHIKQMVVIVLNNNKCGYSKPLVSRKIDDYFQMFLSDRSEFKKTYNI